MPEFIREEPLKDTVSVAGMGFMTARVDYRKIDIKMISISELISRYFSFSSF